MGPEIEYAHNAPLTQLLGSVERPGDFCAHGRLFLPMPTIEVADLGLLSFPVPESQVRALIDVAERAPYGKGAQTLVDTSVRNCWQIDASKLRIGGHAWRQTLATILDAAATGIGCGVEALVAQLYKLLVYPTGGFFAPHRDTEKVNGMVATLTISLPTNAEGGEIVVRHGDREAVIDMHAVEPSELAFAAFYADCTHETRPVRAGHRLSLVYNLCVLPSDADTPRQAPDHAAQIEAAADCLNEWRRNGDQDKLVWLLEHDYSEAGLSFGTLKNADDAVGRVLVGAAKRADCTVHAAIVHVREEGEASYSGGGYVESWHWREPDVADMEIVALYSSRHWLDGWIGADGGRPAVDEIPLLPEELLPAGALDDAEPDERRVHEASGNEGVSLERTYRRAAIVIWPEAKTLAVIASAGVRCAVEWLASQRAEDSASPERVRRLANGLIGLWWHDRREREEDAARSRVAMLNLAMELGGATLIHRFLREVALIHYSGYENASLSAAVQALDPDAAATYLPDFVDGHFERLPDQTLALLRSLQESPAGLADNTFRISVQSAVSTLPGMWEREVQAGWSPHGRYEAIGFSGIRDLFVLAWRSGDFDAATTAASLVSSNPKRVSPDRTIPAVLDVLRHETGLAETAAFANLWRQATGFLLTRSATTPEAPTDWTITHDIDCSCELCTELVGFCADPAAQTHRFPVRSELRGHLHGVIDRHRLDMFHETERRGRPYTLVCTKNRASHERRLVEYADDVAAMQSLLQSTPGGDWTDACAASVARLQVAVAEQ